MQDQSGASSLSIGGGPRRGNGYLLEGVPITDLLNRASIVPSIEAVEDLKVQVKTYDADMGRAAGGVFNTTAKSGSNDWHGSSRGHQQAGMGHGPALFRQESRTAQAGAVLLRLGQLGRRSDRQEQDLLLRQHGGLQAEEHAQQRAHAADGAGAQRRLLADAQHRRAAGRHLRSADDPARPGQSGPVHPRSVPRQPHPGQPAQSGGAGDADAAFHCPRRASRSTATPRCSTDRRIRKQ